MLQNGISDTAAIGAKARSHRDRTRPERRRYNGRSAEACRVRTLEKQFREQLGEQANDPITMLAIKRAAEMVMLAESMRARAIRGEAIDVGMLIRLEGASARALRLLFDLGNNNKREDDAASSLADYLQMSGSVSLATSERDSEPEEAGEALGASRVAPKSKRRADGRFAARRKASGKASTSGDEETR